MTDREMLLTAIADAPTDAGPRLVLADWLEEHGESDRAAFVRLQCEAARFRPGAKRRAELLRRADDLLCEHEQAWLGGWADRLIDWEFDRGFIRSAQLTAATFLRHGEALFRTEPVIRVELVNEEGGPLPAEAVREVVASPAFAHVRGCSVVPGPDSTDSFLVDTWLQALAAAPHVIRLRAFGPAKPSGLSAASAPPTDFGLYNEFNVNTGIDDRALAAFCRAGHLRTLNALDLSCCPIGPSADKDRLASLIAEAGFAARLRRLALPGCRLTEAGIGRIATDSVFRGLRQLDVSWNTPSAEVWRALFHSATLARVSDLTITANHLPQYADSPATVRVRRLTVNGWNDLERDTHVDGEAWARLVATGCPPRRLTLGRHNPGEEAFAAMRPRWLREVHTLTLRGDSQYGVYCERTEGIELLLRSGALPRLAWLCLHEVADRQILAALESWPGLGRLEELSLTDDYFGRLWPEAFVPARPLNSLRRLSGVTIQTEADAEAFLHIPGLGRLRDLELSFVGEFTDGGTFQRVTAESAAQLLTAPVLQRLESLYLGFDDLPELMDSVVRLFADPGLMPRLRALSVFGYAEAQEAIIAIQPRFGLRLRA